ncbi:MAG: tRNA (adenosine(37)-N6)-threonylcarbamoyltransferase complex dimerization subunit type 1 TsaB [Chloroflexota bacterium]
MILAIDTATKSVSLALTAGDETLAESTWQSANNHTIELAPAVKRMLSEARVSAESLAAVAVAIGPGSFTGVRIGLAFAKGLALARRLPLIGVRTLDIAVRPLPLSTAHAIAVLQAGRGRVVWARYQAGAHGWESASAGEVGRWEEVAAQASGGECVIGEIDSAGFDLLARRGIKMADPSDNARQAVCLAQIAWERWRRGEADSAETLAPIYAHQPTSGNA